MSKKSITDQITSIATILNSGGKTITFEQLIEVLKTLGISRYHNGRGASRGVSMVYSANNKAGNIIEAKAVKYAFTKKNGKYAWL